MKNKERGKPSEATVSGFGQKRTAEVAGKAEQALGALGRAAEADRTP